MCTVGETWKSTLQTFQNGLAFQLWGAWAADGPQLLAPAGLASEGPRATWPQLTPSVGQPEPSD